MAMVTLAVMVAYSGQLTLIVCATAAMYAVLRIALYRPLFHAQQEQIAHSATQQSSFLETIRGIQSVKLFNRQSQRRTLHENLLVRNFNAGIRVQRLEILYRALNGSLFGIENIAVIWLAALLVLDSQFTVGMLFAFIAFKTTFVTRVIAFTDKAVELRMLGLHAERVADIALTEAEPVSTKEVSPTLAADIEFRNVTFRYSGYTPPIVQDLSFKISAGESVAIVGPSGCGKTTLLKLLLGLLQPTEGEVLIGGVSIAHLAPAHLDLIGTVMQDDKLFAGSLADNICFFDAHADQSSYRRMRAARGDPRRHHGDADGIRHAHRRDGRRPLRRTTAARAARPRALQATRNSRARRSHESSRRGLRARRERSGALARAHPNHHCASTGNHCDGRPDHRATECPGIAGEGPLAPPDTRLFRGGGPRAAGPFQFHSTNQVNEIVRN